MYDYVEKVGATINRSSYAAAQQAGLVTLSLRERLCRLFKHPDPGFAIITPGATAGLNMLIKGLLRPGDHCIVSAMEHNAVMRPLVQLERQGVSFDRVPCDTEGRMDISALSGLVRPNTRLVLIAHASNVSGTVQDAEAVGKYAPHTAYHLRSTPPSLRDTWTWISRASDSPLWWYRVTKACWGRRALELCF